MLGALCALWVHKYGSVNLHVAVKFALMLLIVYLACIGFDSIHPRVDAVLMVASVGAILIGRDGWLPRVKIVSFVEWLGDRSYSLYLVHWPIFVFAYIVYLGKIPVISSIFLVGLSIFLAHIQFNYVEVRFKQTKTIGTVFGWKRFFAASVACLSSSIAFFAWAQNSDLLDDEITTKRRLNYGLSEMCEGSIRDGIVNSECIASDSTKVVIWGDSFAMHLVPGLVKSNPNITQLTLSSCGPIVDLAPRHKYTESWARICLNHNRQALDYILNNKDVTHVILASAFGQYFKNDRFYLNGQTESLGADEVREQFEKTIFMLKSAGKIPIIFSPPPRSGLDIGECLERSARGLPIVGASCDIDFKAYQKHESKILDQLKKASITTEARLFLLSDIMCNGDVCQSKIGEKFLYRDGGHLSIEGSEAILESFSIGNNQ